MPLYGNSHTLRIYMHGEESIWSITNTVKIRVVLPQTRCSEIVRLQRSDLRQEVGKISHDHYYGKLICVPSRLTADP
jgi:hypothetical protein